MASRKLKTVVGKRQLYRRVAARVTDLDIVDEARLGCNSNPISESNTSLTSSQFDRENSSSCESHPFSPSNVQTDYHHHDPCPSDNSVVYVPNRDLGLANLRSKNLRNELGIK